MHTVVGCTVLAYADDICIIAKDRASMETCLQVLEREGASCNLSINGAKSGFMVTHDIAQHPPLILQAGEIPCLGASSYKYLGVLINQEMSPRDQLTQLDQYVQWQCNALQAKKLTVPQKVYLAEAVIAAHVVYAGCCYAVPPEHLAKWQARLNQAILHGVARSHTHSAQTILLRPKHAGGVGMKALQGLFQAQALRTIGREVHKFGPLTDQGATLVSAGNQPILQHTIWQGFPHVSALQNTGCTIVPNHVIPKSWACMGEIIQGLMEAAGKIATPAALFGPLLQWDGPAEHHIAKLCELVHLYYQTRSKVW